MGIPARQHWLASSHAVWRVSGGGLRITALPAIRAASTPPAGIAYGKFHGDATTTTPYGRRSGGNRPWWRSSGRSRSPRRPRGRPRGRSWPPRPPSAPASPTVRRPSDRPPRRAGCPLRGRTSRPRRQRRARGGDDVVDRRHVGGQRVLPVGAAVGGVLGDGRGDVGRRCGSVKSVSGWLTNAALLADRRDAQRAAQPILSSR